MSGLAQVVMLVVCGTVWGGFLSLLVFAFRRESSKSDHVDSGKGP